MRKLKLRIKRHNKLRQRIVGTTARPRLSVFKSGQHIYAQIIDDLKGQTLVSSSDIKNKESNKREKHEHKQTLWEGRWQRAQKIARTC